VVRDQFCRVGTARLRDLCFHLAEIKQAPSQSAPPTAWNARPLIYRSLRCSLIAGPLVNVLNGSSITLLQICGARKLSFCQFEMRRRNTELGCRLRQRDLVRLRVDREEKISFMCGFRGKANGIPG
jgi:hypothetical protein